VNMLKTVLIALGRDKTLDLLIAGAEALKEIDINPDSEKDEAVFNFLIKLIEALR